MHFVLGFIMHRLGLRQMPIKYELITTILCRSIRFTQYYGALSLSFWPGPLSLSFPSLSNTRIGKRAHENFLTLTNFDFYSLFCVANWTFYTPCYAALSAAASARICIGFFMLYLTENRAIVDRNSVHFSDATTTNCDVT